VLVSRASLLKYIKGKGKGKVVPALSMKAYEGTRCPAALNLCTRWRLVVSFTLRPLGPGKEPRSPLKRRLGEGGVSESVQTYWRREESLGIAGTRGMNHPTHSIVCQSDHTSY
jgi:hypothetical protein